MILRSDQKAIEIVSENEMYAYGWCYSVNGFEPNVYPHEVFINPEGDDQIIWWFGFAHYLNGQWLSMCEPSYERKPDFLWRKSLKSSRSFSIIDS